jgi:ribose 5-phosphate isomerase
MLSSQSSIDKKLSIIFDKYRDRDFAANAQKEVEDIRRKALHVGAGSTAAIFFVNELARLSMRSRKYHPSIQGISTKQAL